jgi:hypothetical protein
MTYSVVGSMVRDAAFDFAYSLIQLLETDALYVPDFVPKPYSNFL